MDPNTAVKIRGCFIGIPGRREAQPVAKSDMHLAKVVADLHFVASEWWGSRTRPQIANSDRSVWGMLDASEVLKRIQRFLNSDNDPDADTYLLCYSGHGHRDGGKWCCDNDSYVSFEQVIELWQSAARRDGHRLVLYVDACYSGHWALKARDLALAKVVVQTSCSNTETSLDGVFTKAFVNFQISEGAARPCSRQLCSRAPFVYVPWPACTSDVDSVIFKDNKGSANHSRPYMHLLAHPDNKFHRRKATAITASASAAAEAQRRWDAEAVAAAAAEAVRKRAQAAAAAVAAEAQRASRMASSSSAAAAAPSCASNLQTSQPLLRTAKAPNKTTATGIEWAATHHFPNEDLAVHGGDGGWPPRLFGPERSRALAAMGITKFSQLMTAVKSRGKEQFYKEFGTCDGKVGALDTAANTMWEVCMAWDSAGSSRLQSAPAAAAVSRAVPAAAQRTNPVNVQSARCDLQVLLDQMQIDLQILRNAAGGKSLSQKGLNKPEIERVLTHFKDDCSGSRQDLNSKLSQLLGLLRGQ